MVNFGPTEAQNYMSLWPKCSMIKTKKLMKITFVKLTKKILIWAKCAILG